MVVKILKGVPIPEKSRGSRKYPWDELRVGDSFVVTTRTNGVQLCRQANHTRTPKLFESRVVGGKTRVWRTQ